MSIPRCPVCKEMLFESFPHHCKPKYFVIPEDWLDFEYDETKPIKNQPWELIEPGCWHIYFSNSAEIAAQSFMDQYWGELDYLDKINLIVRDESGNFYRFRIVPEQTVYFDVEELEKATTEEL